MTSLQAALAGALGPDTPPEATPPAPAPRAPRARVRSVPAPSASTTKDHSKAAPVIHHVWLDTAKDLLRAALGAIWPGRVPDADVYATLPVGALRSDRFNVGAYVVPASYSAAVERHGHRLVRMTPAERKALAKSDAGVALPKVTVSDRHAIGVNVNEYASGMAPKPRTVESIIHSMALAFVTLRRLDKSGLSNRNSDWQSDATMLGFRAGNVPGKVTAKGEQRTSWADAYVTFAAGSKSGAAFKAAVADIVSKVGPIPDGLLRDFMQPVSGKSRDAYGGYASKSCPVLTAAQASKLGLSEGAACPFRSPVRFSTKQHKAIKAGGLKPACLIHGKPLTLVSEPTTPQEHRARKARKRAEVKAPDAPADTPTT